MTLHCKEKPADEGSCNACLRAVPCLHFECPGVPRVVLRLCARCLRTVQSTINDFAHLPMLESGHHTLHVESTRELEGKIGTYYVTTFTVLWSNNPDCVVGADRTYVTRCALPDHRDMWEFAQERVGKTVYAEALEHNLIRGGTVILLTLHDSPPWLEQGEDDNPYRGKSS